MIASDWSSIITQLPCAGTHKRNPFRSPLHGKAPQLKRRGRANGNLNIHTFDGSAAMDQGRNIADKGYHTVRRANSAAQQYDKKAQFDVADFVRREPLMVLLCAAFANRLRLRRTIRRNALR